MQTGSSITVAAVTEQHGRFLLVEEMAWGRKVLNQPSGHLEAGESLIDAVIRETREETGWAFEPDGVIGIYRWVHPVRGHTILRVAFSGHTTGHDSNIQLDDGILRALWLTEPEVRQRLDAHRSPMVLACLNDYSSGKPFSLDMLRELVPISGQRQSG